MMMLFLKNSEILTDAILNKINGLNKARKKFLIHLFLLFMGLRGRYNFLNMARYGLYSEQTYRNNFEKNLDFMSLNKEVIKSSCSENLVLAFDPTYIPKSGKSTPNLGKFWSGCARQTLKGLEIGGIAAIDIDNNTAMSLEAVQTPNPSDLDSKGMSLIDHYAELIIERKDTLLDVSEYLTVDGYFAKQKFINGVCKNTRLHVISKFRDDANLRYLYEGVQSSGKGRPRLYEGKIDVSNINKKKITLCYENKDEKVYSGIVYSICLKRKIRIAYVEFLKDGEPSGYYAILFSTNLTLDGELIYRYYKARYQIEFLFRDTKQHVGLNHCQARSENKLYFHFNACLTTVSIAKAVYYLPLEKDKRNGFSMSDIKTLHLNKLIADRIFSNLEIDLNCKKINQVYRQALFYGKIAA